MRNGAKPRLDPAEVMLGERLFLETRFSQFFFARCGGDVNTNLSVGDPVLDNTLTTAQTLPGPFAGLSMNCRACHLIKEQMPLGRGIRAYADFARRSPIPGREDGQKFTPRNAPAMVNASIPRFGETFFHLDGEFATGAELVRETFLGRNFGWLPTEHDQAMRHLAKVIREDDGKGQLAKEFGGYSYKTVFKSAEKTVAENYELTEDYRIDVASATDREVLDAVARMTEVYTTSLFFSRNDKQEYDGSPYDTFLGKNDLPRRVAPGQEPAYYARILHSMVTNLTNTRFVSPADNCYRLLKLDFRFNKLELEGMKIFFARNAGSSRSGIGNCVACHTPPDFTDFSFHNTGVAQEEYDSIHGKGAFRKLPVPTLAERQKNFDAFLPATPKHPKALGVFLSIPSLEHPERTDLGLWNVFANPDKPSVQATLRQTLDPDGRVSEAQLLERTIATFKTPGLRGLAMSAPFMHNGTKDTVEGVIRFYIKASRQARAGELRNADPELSKMFLSEDDLEPLSAFLRALNEDYE
ncbi:MAG: hypothetical protein JWM16_2217 [Verrucomicrobiales bacterium]|nr:hypothetical protein [Verrucomicrobiales bacterium]